MTSNSPVSTSIIFHWTVIIDNQRQNNNEQICDIEVLTSNLNGCELDSSIAKLMIDEYPILSIAATFASSPSVFRGLKELRVKESNRLSAIADGLIACGVDIEIDRDDLIINGSPNNIPGGALIEARMDHRIAMSFLVLGMNSKKPVEIDDTRHIGTSFPNFTGLMNKLGAKIIEPRQK